MKGETYHVEDNGKDVLSHKARMNRIHILTLDKVLSDEIYERIRDDPRLKDCELIRPKLTDIKQGLVEIEKMAPSTVTSKLLIIDVRRSTLPRLQQNYNKIIGYNRRDLNKLCYTILIGDGPMNLFHAGKCLDVFVPHLASHRTDYHPAVFFYDPFLHYEPDEIPAGTISYESPFPTKLPRRLAPYFTGQNITIADVRRYFRATGKSAATKQKRLKTLIGLYKKRINEQFSPHHCQLEDWLSKEGIQLATERLHLYPLFFEDWVYELMEKASKN